MKDKQAEGQVVNWRKVDTMCLYIKIPIPSALPAFFQEEWRVKQLHSISFLSAHHQNITRYNSYDV